MMAAFLYITRDKNTAFVLFRIGLVGPLVIPAIIIHFCINIVSGTKKKIFRIISGGAYIFAFILLIKNMTGFVGYSDIINVKFGWKTVLDISFWSVGYFIYNTFVHIFSMIILISYAKKTELKIIKKQASIIFICISLSFILTLVLDFIFKNIDTIFIPEFSHLIGIIWITGTWYAMVKYNLLIVTPQMASEKIIMSMMDFAIITDAEGKILKANKQTELLLDFSPNKLINMSIGEVFIHPAPVLKIMNLLRSKENTVHNIENSITTSGSNEVPVILSISKIMNRTGDIIGYVFVGHDEREKKELRNEVDKRYLAEAELKKTSTEYKATIDALNAFLIVVDRDMKITLMNKALRNHTSIGGIKIEVGETKLSEIKTIFKNNVIESIHNVFNNGEQSMIVEKIENDNQEFWSETQFIPVFNNNYIEKVLIISTDITDRKKMEDYKLKSGLADSISLLSGGIAHDFNNILTSILGNIGIGKRYAEENEFLFEILESVEKAGLAAKDLTSQLSTFSKGGTPLLETHHINTWLKETCSFFLSGSGIYFEIRIPGDLWMVSIDKKLMSRVLQNLLINTKEAMRDKGKIEIKAYNSIIENYTIPDLLPGKYVKIELRDFGEGIEKKNLSKIFDPYFSTKNFGSGLGLSIAYSIVRKHKGTIEVTSKKGEGTTFSIYLPVSTENPVKAQVKVETTVKGSGKLLIMDDDDIVRTTIQKMLMELGYEVDSAPNGHEALELYTRSLVEKVKYDAVILDLIVPGSMGGEETLTNLKEIDPEVKAIVCSGYSENNVLSGYREYGFCGMVRKPFRIEELSRVIRNVLNGNL
ncbi:MAG: response regulator [Spirochaetales bacterium]|nr:response regulator [Spirochaetales bacterium]